MDGIHDLGGREGFGSIQGTSDGEPFHEQWETRAFGLAQAAAGDSDWSIDWFRHCRELIVPADYLTRSYFDHWLLTLAAQMIDAGYITLAELKSGASTFTPQPGLPPETPDEARAYVKNPRSYAVEIEAPPSFALGESIRAKISGQSGHTRLPGYVRGRKGTIFAHHGGHVFPDASARGEQKAEHLYTISFAASELWPEPKDRRDHVFVDLWESYLERS
ncbi:nitrile hydratase subunit beta [Mesorhizobium sp.]|uniref:nitrile hydratase subunit beta n=1 Tax=Mesorhizobium sp. TaxID=1871066 RepID=UPI000FE6FF24|nr:nitrile hydratase subunit beta [Mesorhizobium sp.]RWE30484.1 MAG: nitrile hydratase subunit beta [Mesorhizobium sp.]